jgi:hypothetical protein
MLAAYEAVFKLEDGLAAIAAANLEELKLKARYVDADCIVGLDEQINFASWPRNGT